MTPVVEEAASIQLFFFFFLPAPTEAVDSFYASAATADEEQEGALTMATAEAKTWNKHWRKSRDFGRSERSVARESEVVRKRASKKKGKWCEEKMLSLQFVH